MESSGYLHNQSIHKQDHVYTGHSPPGAAGGRPRERGWLAGSDGKALEYRHQSESLATLHGVLLGVYYLAFYIIPVECTHIPKVGL